MNGGGRIIYSSALLDSETPINRIVARCNDRMGSDPHTYQKYLAAFSKISNLLNYGKHYSEKWKIDAVIAEETDLILVGLKICCAHKKAVCCNGWLKLGQRQFCRLQTESDAKYFYLPVTAGMGF